MAIKFQYNKTSLGDLGKQLKMRQKALPTIKSKESALRSEVKKAKEAAQEFRSQLSRLEAEYDYMVSLWGEFDCDLLRIAARWSCWISHAVKPLRRSTSTRRYRFPVTRMPYARSNDSLRTRRTSRNRHRKS